jgi:hypothetical protein
MGASPHAVAALLHSSPYSSNSWYNALNSRQTNIRNSNAEGMSLAMVSQRKLGLFCVVTVRRKSPSHSWLISGTIWLEIAVTFLTSFQQSMACFSAREMAVTFPTSFQAKHCLFQYEGNRRYIPDLTSRKNMVYFRAREISVTFLTYFRHNMAGNRCHIPDFISGKVWFISVRGKSPSHSWLHFSKVWLVSG